MTLLGLDFDNTLVRYDKLFHKLAKEKGLIEHHVPEKKTAVRDYLNRRGKGEEFTLLQGEVYGRRIMEAEPAKGMLKALKEIHERGIQTVLISHKTKIPYKGPSYDLRKAAWDWLNHYGFLDKAGLGWDEERVFFASTKAIKIEMIKELGCTHYVDDLPEILDMLPKEVCKILYNPDKRRTTYKSFTDWNMAASMIITK